MVVQDPEYVSVEDLTAKALNGGGKGSNGPTGPSLLSIVVIGVGAFTAVTGFFISSLPLMLLGTGLCVGGCIMAVKSYA